MFSGKISKNTFFLQNTSNVYSSVVLIVTITYKSCLYAKTVQEKYFSYIYEV